MAYSGQANERVIAHLAQGFRSRGGGGGPTGQLFEQQRSDEIDDGFVVCEDTNHLCAPIDLAVQALGGNGSELGSVFPGKLQEASASYSASSMMAASCDTFGRNCSTTVRRY